MILNKMFLLLFFFLSAASCNDEEGKKADSQEQLAAKEMPTKKSSMETTSDFIPGPEITPSNELLNWLNSQAEKMGDKRKRMRLPVVIQLDPTYRDRVTEAYIGGESGTRSEDKIFLDLDDSGMSMGLIRQLKGLCNQEASTCGVWLEGYWGSLLVEDSENDSENWPFAVLKCMAMDEVPAEPLRVYIEK